MTDAFAKEQMQDRRDAELLARPDPEFIYLAPRCEGLSSEGRAWCEDRHDCEDEGCGLKAVKYIKADTFEIVREASRLFEQAANSWMERALKAETALKEVQ